MIKTIPAILVLSMVGAHCLSAAAIYQITVNTSSLSGEADNLDFQLNPGGLTSPAVTAVISDFMTDGTFAPDDIVLTGDATGLLSDEVILNNTNGYNDAYQPIDLGTYVSFLATFSGPGIDTPGDVGTFFGFSLYDSTGTIPLLTGSPDGTIADVTADSLNGVQDFTNPDVTGQSFATVELVTPEPVTWLLTGLGIASFATIRRRQKAETNWPRINAD